MTFTPKITMRVLRTRWELPCVTALAMLFVVGFCLAGCGGPKNKHGRLPFSGTVTLDGQPLMGGLIVFEPKSGQPTQSGGMISNGAFDVPEAAGAAPGMYSVAIYSGAEPPTGNFQPGTPEYEAAARQAPGERVPRKFNIDTTLTREVKAGEENKFTFELTTK